MKGKQRIMVHDYAGHPFQVQLSRALARRGHAVLHVYSSSVQTPHGRVEQTSKDPPNLRIAAIHLNGQVSKNALVRRRMQEVRYGKLAARVLDEFRPTVVISANTPIEPQVSLLRQSRRVGAAFVFWLQDVYGLAVEALLKKRLPVVGTLVGSYYRRLEQRALRASDAVILITDDFFPWMTKWGVHQERLHVIENWAPLDEVPVYPKTNQWATSHGLAERFCFLYSGTLGMKHNPRLLLELARAFQHSGVQVVVCSEGPGADWLRDQAQGQAIHNLTVLGFQPYSLLPQVLAAADVLVAILERDAGVFSVPSKVLTYLCAGRPLLLAVPAENLAAQLVTRNRAGITVPPDDLRAFIEAAQSLVAQPSLREQLGRNARAYAENHFDIERIADKFEAILKAVSGGGG